MQALGLSRFDMKYSAGTLPHDKLMTSIELYGDEVAPRVRARLAELRACVDEPARASDQPDTAGVSTPIILDCDPGHDDAIALLLALASPEVDVLGVTTVHGNQTLEKTTANALRVLDLAGRTGVPVAAGAERPLARELTWRRTSTARVGSTAPRCRPRAGRRWPRMPSTSWRGRSPRARPGHARAHGAADERRAAARRKGGATWSRSC